MTHVIANLLHMSTAAAWEVVLSLTYMIGLFILFAIVTNWRSIRSALRWIAAFANEVVKAQMECERNQIQDETNLFI